MDFIGGEMNQAFEGSRSPKSSSIGCSDMATGGWLRLAEVQSANDTELGIESS